MVESNHSSDKMESDPSTNDSTHVVKKYGNKELDQECEDLKHGVGYIIAENSKLLEAVKVNKKRIQSQAEIIDALQNDITNVSAENSQLKETNEGLHAENIRLNDTVTSLKTSLTEKQEMISQQAEEIQKEKTENSQLKETNEGLQAENIRLDNAVASLQSSLETSEAEKAELAKSKNECDAEIVHLQTSLTQKQEMINQKKEVIDRKTVENAQLIATKEGLQVEINRLNNTVTSLQSSLETSEAEKSEITKSKKECDAEIVHLQTSLTEKQEMINQKDEEIQKEKTENSQLKETMEELRVINIQLHDTVASLQTSLETEKAERVPEASVLKSTHDAEETELQNKINCFKNEVANMKSNLETSVASVSQLQNDKSELQQECASMDDTKNELDVKIRQQIKKVQKLMPEARQMQNHPITELKNETTYKIKDVFIDRKFDYEKLNGKVLVVEKLEYEGKDKTMVDGYEISTEKANFKVYVQKKLNIFNNFSICDSVQCNNIKELRIYSSIGSYSAWKELISSCPHLKELCLSKVTVKDENGVVIKIDQLWKDILENCPYIECLYYTFKKNEVTSTTVQKLSQLPPFPNLDYVDLAGIEEGFDLVMFGEFVKKNPSAYYRLRFFGSNQFKSKIRAAEKELRQTLPSTCK